MTKEDREYAEAEDKEWGTMEERGLRFDETLRRWVPKEYQGCRNCEFQIEPLRQCEWAESGGDNDGVVRFVCPRWEKRKEIKHES